MRIPVRASHWLPDSWYRTNLIGQGWCGLLDNISAACLFFFHSFFALPACLSDGSTGRANGPERGPLLHPSVIISLIAIAIVSLVVFIPNPMSM